MSGLFSAGGDVGQNQQQAPLSSFNVQSSAYGLPVPILWGRNRVAANLIWYGDFTAIAHEQSMSGGKGGGGSTSSTSYTYSTSVMWGLCEGEVKSINGYWKDSAALSGVSGVITTFKGSDTQNAWSYLTNYHMDEALNYRGHAYACVANYDLGSSSSLGNHSFDITGQHSYSSMIDEANPRDVIYDFLTNPIFGAGFKGSLIGDWGLFSAWCVANSFFISPLLTSQAAANSTLNDWFTVFNSGVFFSEKKLKIVPFSDANATANGITYSPNVTPVFDFDDDDYLNFDQPVKVSRIQPSDAYNQVVVEYLDKTNSYNKDIATAQDQAAIELYGLKPKDAIQADYITDGATARLAAQIVLQKLLYTANTYEFTVGVKYCQLEPCDYVTLTDLRLGLDHVPVRILSVEENDQDELVIVAEDAPSGVSHAAHYDQQPGSGYVVDFNVSPGSVIEPEFFEVPAKQALSGLAIGIAVTGDHNEKWGGCDVYASNDGASFAYMGTVNQPARYGITTSEITAAVDQVVGISLAGNGGQLLSGSEADAANNSTSLLIGDEFISYTTAELVSENNYNLTAHVRGLHATTAAAHAVGKRVVRVDTAIVYSNSLDLSMIGKTLHFKFLSFNIYGMAKEKLADVAEYAYTVRGNMARLAPPGITDLVAELLANGVSLSWENPVDKTNFASLEVWRGESDVVPGVSGSDARLVVSLRNNQEGWVDYIGSGGDFFYFIRSLNYQDYPSAFLGPVSASVGHVGGIEIMDALPTDGNFDGRLVYLTEADGPNPAKLLYRYSDAIDAFTSSIDPSQIPPGTIVAQMLSVAKLDAISADLGAVNAGSININNKFIVGPDGVMNCIDANISGALNAVTGTFAGSLMAGVVDMTQLDGFRQGYTSPGTYYYTIPVGKERVRLTICGGSGGGGGGGKGFTAGAGGGGGGASKATVVTMDIPAGTVLTVVVGPGGNGGAVGGNGASGGSGGGGTASSITSTTTGTITAAGGGGGGGGDPINMTGEGSAGAAGGGGGSGGNGGNSGSNGGGASYAYSYVGGINTRVNGAGGNGGAGHRVGGRGGNGGSLGGGAASGSNGLSGYVYIESFNPNAVVLQDTFDELVSALYANGTLP